MKSTVRLSVCVAMTLTMFSTPCSWAGSVAGTGGATEVTQLLNMGQLIQSTLQQAQQLALQTQAALTNPNTPWSQTLQALQQLRQVYNTGQQIGYSLQSVEQNFKNLYPGYGNSSGNTLNNLINWGNQTRSAVQGALQTAGWTMDQVQSGGQLIDTLRQQSQSAQGQMQATQGGNAIAVEMVQQLRSLSQLQAAQAQAQGSYLAGINEKATQEQAVTTNFFSGPPVSETGKGMSIK